MQSCSVRGCESYKTIQSKPVAYFKFPFHNGSLLKTWLSQINQENFIPTQQDQICSTHFLIDDIEPSSIGRYPILKDDAVPTVFPKSRNETNSEDVKCSQKVESKPAAKREIIPQFETVLLPELVSPPSGIPILPKPTLIQTKPTVISPKVLHFSNKSTTLQPAQLITSPVQNFIQTKSSPIKSGGVQKQSQPIQIQPKPIQLQRIQFQSAVQNFHFQPHLIQVQPQIQFQATPIELHQNSPLQGIQSNGKFIPLKQIPFSQIQEIISSQNNAQKPKTVDVKSSPVKPNILVKSKTENANSYPDSRRPILKISINKVNEEKSKNSEVTESKENSVRFKPEEVQIKALNKSVIFRLEPSGKIVVETKEGPQAVQSQGKPQTTQPQTTKPQTTQQQITKPLTTQPLITKPQTTQLQIKKLQTTQPQIKTQTTQPQMKTQTTQPLMTKPQTTQLQIIKLEPTQPQITKSPVIQPQNIIQQIPLTTPVKKEISSPDPKLTNLKSLYNKAQEDCEKLSKKLASLKRRHQEEQEQIFKLQGNLTGIDNKVQSGEFAGSSSAKLRRLVHQKDEDLEYEKLLKDVKKIKENYDMSANSKLNKDQFRDIKAGDISRNSSSCATKNITQDNTINTTGNQTNAPYIYPVKKRVLRKMYRCKPQRRSKYMNPRLLAQLEEEERVDEPDFRESLKKTDGEIIGIIDEENEAEANFGSDDEMNFEVEYLDPEFIDC